MVQAQLTRSEEACQILKAAAAQARVQLKVAAERLPPDGTTAVADSALVAQVLLLRPCNSCRKPSALMQKICVLPVTDELLLCAR